VAVWPLVWGQRGADGRRLGLDTDEIIREISEKPVLKIDREELTAILEEAEVIRSEDTALAGWIRILSIAAQVVVQEETPERDVLIRRFASVDAANKLVDERLADYERMWDGCGCKIDYYAPTSDR
jgi:hypothetical protein